MTPAVRLLIEHKIDFTCHFYDYEEKGGTARSSKELGVDEHAVVKTLVMETDDKKPLVVLMHGDQQVSTKQLAREMGVKTVKPCAPDTANRHSGYMVGGTSPFGTRKEMPIYMQKTIADLPRVFINGGQRGFLVNVAVADIVRLLKPTLAEISAD